MTARHGARWSGGTTTVSSSISDRLRPSSEPAAEKIDARATLLVVTGKLRGSAAKTLARKLEALSQTGVRQVVLDLRSVRSIDSLGGWAIRQALELGGDILAVAGPREVVFAIETDARRDPPTPGRLRWFESIHEALGAAGLLP